MVCLRSGACPPVHIGIKRSAMRPLNAVVDVCRKAHCTIDDIAATRRQTRLRALKRTATRLGWERRLELAALVDQPPPALSEHRAHVPAHEASGAVEAVARHSCLLLWAQPHPLRPHGREPTVDGRSADKRSLSLTNTEVQTSTHHTHTHTINPALATQTHLHPGTQSKRSMFLTTTSSQERRPQLGFC